MFLSLSIGSIFFVFIVAPVIFGSSKYLGAFALTLFQSSFLMTTMFIKLNSLLTLSTIFIIIYEVTSFIFIHKNRFIALVAIVSIVSSILFIFYFVPRIANMLYNGKLATDPSLFASLHEASEVNFMTLFLSLVLLLFTRCYGRKNS